jgi:polyisoprenyl-phosphate glycosyltransferase
MANTKVELSIIAPLFNEEEVLPLFLKEVIRVCDTTKKEYEIILVDDGSKDKTFELAEEEAKKNKKIKVVRFSRNFGHQPAFGAGLNLAQGDMVVTMDGDLQHPPKLIPEFIKYAESGSDIVIGERMKNEQNSAIRDFAGKMFYKFLSTITNLEFKNVSDFALYKKKAVLALRSLPEKERFLRGLVQWVGFRKTYVPYIVENRKAGSPKYTAKKLFGLIMSGVTSFSAFPLRMAFWVGLLAFLSSIVFSGYVFWNHYTDPNPFLVGWATLVILVLIFGSIQLMVLGVIGEYLYKMFNEVKGRPTYIISETVNLNKEETNE